MPNYNVVLRQNFPNRPPSALALHYTMRTGPAAIYPVTAVGAVQDRATMVLNSPTVLPTSNVAARVLVADFPVAPTVEERTVSSVQI